MHKDTKALEKSVDSREYFYPVKFNGDLCREPFTDHNALDAFTTLQFFL